MNNLRGYRNLITSFWTSEIFLEKLSMMHAGNDIFVVILDKMRFTNIRSTFLEAGFNADEYSNELEELKKVHKPEPQKSHGGAR